MVKRKASGRVDGKAKRGKNELLFEAGLPSEPAEWLLFLASHPVVSLPTPKYSDVAKVVGVVYTDRPNSMCARVEMTDGSQRYLDIPTAKCKAAAEHFDTFLTTRPVKVVSDVSQCVSMQQLNELLNAFVTERREQKSRKKATASKTSKGSRTLPHKITRMLLQLALQSGFACARSPEEAAHPLVFGNIWVECDRAPGLFGAVVNNAPWVVVAPLRSLLPTVAEFTGLLVEASSLLKLATVAVELEVKQEDPTAPSPKAELAPSASADIIDAVIAEVTFVESSMEEPPRDDAPPPTGCAAHCTATSSDLDGSVLAPPKFLSCDSVEVTDETTPPLLRA